MATRPRMTAKDLWDLPEGDRRQELVNGRIIEMGPPGGVHGKVLGRIFLRLSEHVNRTGGGEVLVGDVGFVLTLPEDPERVRAPDVAYVSRDRLPGGKVPDGYLSGAPDLAVEILSPTDDPIDVQQKVQDFLTGGAMLVWVVAPRARTVTIYRPDGSARFLRGLDVLDGEQLLPGLTIPLIELFQ